MKKNKALICRNVKEDVEVTTEEVTKEPVGRIDENSNDFLNFDEPEKKEDPFKKTRKQEAKKEEVNLDFDEDRLALIKYVEDSYEGETFGDKYKKFVEFESEAKEKLPKYKEVEERYKEKDSELRRINITSSDEWRENIEKPVIHARDSYVAVLADIDDEGNVRNEKQILTLANRLFNEGKDLTPVMIKAILKKFSTDYEQATGEIYEVPAISEIVKARESVIKTLTRRNEAFNNWEKEKKKEEEDYIIEQEERKSKLNESGRKEREDQFKEVSSSFDYKGLSSFFDEKAVKARIEEVYSDVEKALSGEGKMPTYKETLNNQIKARLFDELLTQAEKDRAFVSEHRKIKGDSRERQSGERAPSARQTEDRLNLFDFN